MPGIAALEEYPGGNSGDKPDPAPAGVDEQWSSNHTRGVFDGYRLGASKSTPSHGGDTISRVSRVSSTEVVSPSSSRRGRAPSSSNRGDTSNTASTSSPATNERNVGAHSSSMSWRRRGRPGFTDKAPESTKGPRLTRARSRDRGSRSGSISEGHQSPDYDGESKKKVDWYDV